MEYNPGGLPISRPQKLVLPSIDSKNYIPIKVNQHLISLTYSYSVNHGNICFSILEWMTFFMLEIRPIDQSLGWWFVRPLTESGGFLGGGSHWLLHKVCHLIWILFIWFRNVYNIILTDYSLTAHFTQNVVVNSTNYNLLYRLLSSQEVLDHTVAMLTCLRSKYQLLQQFEKQYL